MLSFQDYITAVPPRAQGMLISVLSLIQTAFPEAERKIYHGIPTFFLRGKDVINVGAYKNHMSLYVSCGVANYLKKKYPEHQYTKSTVRFPYAKRISFDLIREICHQIKKEAITRDLEGLEQDAEPYF